MPDPQPPDGLFETSRRLMDPTARLSIKRFADAKGATGLYHETITWAFLLLIAERQARQPAATWEAFAAAHAGLLVWKPSILQRNYSKELLASELARRTFVMPDRISGLGVLRT